MEIQPVRVEQRQALADFASRIPDRDRSLVDAPLLSQVAVAGWTQAVPERRLAALDDDGAVLGLVTVVRGVGWSSHVADMRVIVDPGARGRGVGRRLADQGLELAGELGMTKVMIEVMAGNTGALAMLGALGFEEEARLRGQVRDSAGQMQDLVLLSRWLEDRPAE
ncbi:MAG: GNAT family N-acetyltransferase [Ilumatobacteraceae bacterium]